jgi:glycosyltransferase involved in cell wall biosynthesis
VLFVTRKWPPAVGGMEVYCAELTRELAARVDLTTRALPGRKDGRPPGSLRLAWFFLRVAFFLARQRNRYDVIHYGDLVMFPLAWWCHRLGRKCRQVISVHGTDIAYGIREGRRPAMYRRLLNWAANNQSAADVLVANSNATANHCARVGFRTIEVIPLGVRPVADIPMPATPESYLLFVGRVARRKGVGWFIRDVLPLLPDHITLKVAGTVWDEDERAALGHPRVEYLGPIFGEDLATLRRHALAVIMPNVPLGGRDFEGFGLTALEAGADGAVLLASALDGIVDAVEDGVTGILVEPGHPGKWADAVLEVESWCPEKRADFLATARKRLETHYSWARVASDTLSCYSTP